MLIINKDSKWYGAWKVVYIVCCFFSSYVYAFYSVFGRGDSESSRDRNFIMGCETVFVMSMLFKFRLTFIKDGETVPTRDPGKIARRYISKDFFFDCVPLVPFEHIFHMGGKE